MKTHKQLALITFALLTAACLLTTPSTGGSGTAPASPIPGTGGSGTAPSPAATRSWDEIHNFTYWLDDPDLARAGVSLQAAQKLARHSDPRLTANTYTSLSTDDLAAELARVPPPPAPNPRRAPKRAPRIVG